MEFISTDLETLISYLNKLDATTQPLWGKMEAQRMIEHLTEGVYMSIGKNMEQFNELLVPADKLPKMRAFLASAEPMPRDFKAPYAPEEYILKNEEIELAVDDFVDAWLAYEEYYESKPNKSHFHPFYGDLNKPEWDRMHAKHFTHHFQQFRLI